MAYIKNGFSNKGAILLVLIVVQVLGFLLKISGVLLLSWFWVLTPIWATAKFMILWLIIVVMDDAYASPENEKYIRP